MAAGAPGLGRRGVSLCTHPSRGGKAQRYRMSRCVVAHGAQLHRHLRTFSWATLRPPSSAGTRCVRRCASSPRRRRGRGRRPVQTLDSRDRRRSILARQRAHGPPPRTRSPKTRRSRPAPHGEATRPPGRQRAAARSLRRAQRRHGAPGPVVRASLLVLRPVLAACDRSELPTYAVSSSFMRPSLEATVVNTRQGYNNGCRSIAVLSGRVPRFKPRRRPPSSTPTRARVDPSSPFLSFSLNCILLKARGYGSQTMQGTVL